MSTQATPRADAGRSELTAALLHPSSRWLAVFGLSLAIGVLMLAPSAFMFEVYGRVLNSRSAETLAWLLLAAVVVYGVLELLELARMRALQQVGRRLTRSLAPRVIDATFDAVLGRSPGVSAQTPNDLRVVADFVASPVVTGVLDLPASLLCLGLLFAMNVWVGLLALAMAAVQALIGLWQERRSSQPYGEVLRASSEAQMRAAGMLRNAQVIEAMGMGRALHGRWAASQKRFMVSLGQASDSAGVGGAATKWVSMVQGSLLLGLAAWAALNNTLAGGMGMVIVASILGGRVLAPMGQIISQWRAIGAARSAWSRLDSLLRAVPAQSPGMELPAPDGVLTAEQLVVRAPGGNAPILRGVSLQCRPGQMLAVIGPSGSGKSTLSRVLVGVWPSEGGKARLDGADVHQWHKSQLGAHIGYLPQGIELFDGTLAENVARFDRVDPERVQRALADVGIDEMVAALPDGMHTRIGEDGMLLSGGQRQRVGLARAIYGEPRLVVLDEPNSSLDEAGDAALLALVRRLKARGATIVVITHRPQLLAEADLVALLSDGALVKFGPTAEVLAALRSANEQAARAQKEPARGPAPPSVPATGSGAAAGAAA